MLTLALLISAALRFGGLFTSESSRVELPLPLGCFGAISMVTFLLWLLLDSMTRYANLRLTNRVMLFDLLSLPIVAFLTAATVLLVARRLRSRGAPPGS